MIPVTIEVNHPDLIVGIVESRSVPGGASDAVLVAEIDAALALRANAASRPTSTGGPSAAPLRSIWTNRWSKHFKWPTPNNLANRS